MGLDMDGPTKASLGTGAANIIFGLTVNEWMILIGLAGLFIPNAIKWHFERKRLQLDREKFERDQANEQTGNY